MSLLSFATLALLSQMLAAIAQGRTFRLTKSDLTAEVFVKVIFVIFDFLMNLFASVAVVTMRNGKANGIL